MLKPSKDWLEAVFLQDALYTSIQEAFSEVLSGAVGAFRENMSNDNTDYVRWMNDYQIQVISRPRIVIEWRNIQDNVIGEVIRSISPEAVAAGIVTIGKGFGWIPHSNEEFRVGAVMQEEKQTEEDEGEVCV